MEVRWGEVSPLSIQDAWWMESIQFPPALTETRWAIKRIESFKSVDVKLVLLYNMFLSF
jgi:hypothetical protein